MKFCFKIRVNSEVLHIILERHYFIPIYYNTTCSFILTWISIMWLVLFASAFSNKCTHTCFKSCMLVSGCPPGSMEHGNSCYYFQSSPVILYQSLASCAKFSWGGKGHLVRPRDTLESHLFGGFYEG